MKRLTDKFIQSPSSYPLTALYSSGVALAVSVSANLISLTAGIIMFTLVAIIAIIRAMAREVRHVHEALEEQRVIIEDLIAALHDAGVPVPLPKQKAAK